MTITFSESKAQVQESVDGPSSAGKFSRAVPALSKTTAASPPCYQHTYHAQQHAKTAAVNPSSTSKAAAYPQYPSHPHYSSMYARAGIYPYYVAPPHPPQHGQYIRPGFVHKNAVVAPVPASVAFAAAPRPPVSKVSTVPKAVPTKANVQVVHTGSSSKTPSQTDDVAPSVPLVNKESSPEESELKCVSQESGESAPNLPAGAAPKSSVTSASSQSSASVVHPTNDKPHHAQIPHHAPAGHPPPHHHFPYYPPYYVYPYPMNPYPPHAVHPVSAVHQARLGHAEAPNPKPVSQSTTGASKVRTTADQSSMPSSNSMKQECPSSPSHPNVSSAAGNAEVKTTASNTAPPTSNATKVAPGQPATVHHPPVSNVENPSGTGQPKAAVARPSLAPRFSHAGKTLPSHKWMVPPPVQPAPVTTKPHRPYSDMVLTDRRPTKLSYTHYKAALKEEQAVEEYKQMVFSQFDKQQAREQAKATSKTATKTTPVENKKGVPTDSSSVAASKAPNANEKPNKASRSPGSPECEKTFEVYLGELADYNRYYKAFDKTCPPDLAKWMHLHRRMYRDGVLKKHSAEVCAIKRIDPTFFEGIGKSRYSTPPVAKAPAVKPESLEKSEVPFMENYRILRNFCYSQQRLLGVLYVELDFLFKRANAPLRGWIREQRRMYNTGLLSPCRRELIQHLVPDFFRPADAIDEVMQDCGLSLQEALDMVKSFVRINGREKKRHTYPTTGKFGKWVVWQRTLYMTEKLPKDVYYRILEVDPTFFDTAHAQKCVTRVVVKGSSSRTEEELASDHSYGMRGSDSSTLVSKGTETNLLGFETSFNQLTEFVNAFGRYPRESDFQGESENTGLRHTAERLFYWVKKQRALYRVGALTFDHEDKLRKFDSEFFFPVLPEVPKELRAAFSRKRKGLDASGAPDNGDDSTMDTTLPSSPESGSDDDGENVCSPKKKALASENKVADAIPPKKKSRKNSDDVKETNVLRPASNTCEIQSRTNDKVAEESSHLKDVALALILLDNTNVADENPKPTNVTVA